MSGDVPNEALHCTSSRSTLAPLKLCLLLAVPPSTTSTVSRKWKPSTARVVQTTPATHISMASTSMPKARSGSSCGRGPTVSGILDIAGKPFCPPPAGNGHATSQAHSIQGLLLLRGTTKVCPWFAVPPCSTTHGRLLQSWVLVTLLHGPATGGGGLRNCSPHDGMASSKPHALKDPAATGMFKAEYM